MNRTQFTIVLAVVAAAGLLGGALSDWLKGQSAFAQENGADAVTAQEFRLVDPEGELRAVLGLRENGMVALVLNDQSGRKRLSVGAGDEGAAVVIGDEEGEKRLAVGFADHAPLIALADKAGRERIALTVAEDTSAVMLQDEAGTGRVGIMLSEGVPFVSLSDREERTRAILSLEAAGTPGLAMFDEDENTIWSAP